MQIAQPINHSLAAALLRRFPTARLVAVEEMSCQFISGEPVSVEGIQAELVAAPPAERVEMLPKVAVDMFRHHGQDEMARQVPHDRQLVEMTRIGSYYGIGFSEGEPAEVELHLDWDGSVGKISALPKGG